MTVVNFEEGVFTKEFTSRPLLESSSGLLFLLTLKIFLNNINYVSNNILFYFCSYLYIVLEYVSIYYNNI